MFVKKDIRFFVLSLGLVLAGFLCMGIDPVESGFGFLTLSLAPVLLLAGFFLPVARIAGSTMLRKNITTERVRANRLKYGVSIFVFSIAFSVYLITLEPTASFWDCGEFIACAYKLQVSHTPGNPLLLLMARMFSFLALGDVTRVAWTINMMSAFFSALTVWLIYFLIYRFVEKLPEGTYQYIPLIAAWSGSMALAFIDSFWFSAVEAEAYGPACFFMVLLVWLTLQGSTMHGEQRSRMLVLIFYASALAYCIHPMCLLAVPLFPLLWYRKNTFSWWNILLLFVLGMAIVMVINRVVAIGVFEMIFRADLITVNAFGLPFYSGLVVFVLLLIGAVYIALTKAPRLSAYTWGVVFLIAGFTPYIVLFIRSNFNPPIDETNPENLAMIKAYMNRESYPSSPLLYGPYYDAAIIDIERAKPAYYKDDSSYKIAGHLSAYRYDPKRQTVFPRLYSNDPAHIKVYQHWAGIKPNEKPTFIHNLTFLFRYQLGHMYARYLLWNFAGREGDVQNSHWLRPWERLASRGDFSEKARNQYWMIPFAIGLVGMFWHFRKDRYSAIMVAALFLMNGVILILYLNPSPGEPRERDYIFVGSYMAFCIWIGIGMTALYTLTKKYNLQAIAIVFALLLPAWIGYQNFDDHNRSGRTFQIDQARNVLNSCAPNAILFTGGDNDTYPFWYLQEVEGVRTDVRVMVLSYFNTDWYIHQLTKPYYQSPAFRLSLTPQEYRQYGAHDVLYLQESIKEPIDLSRYFSLLKANHPALRLTSSTGDPFAILPSRMLRIPVDKTKAAANLTSNLAAQVEDEIILRVKGSFLQKNALAFLDVVLSNDWERPVYFNFTSENQIGVDIQSYLIQDGPLYRFVPVKNKEKGITVDTALMYKNLISNANYENLQRQNVYFNYEDFHLRAITPVRQAFNTLAVALMNQGDRRRAEEVLQYAAEHLYPPHLYPSFTNLHAADLLMTLGRKDLAFKLASAAHRYYTALYEKKRADEFDRMMLSGAEELLEQLQE